MSGKQSAFPFFILLLVAMFVVLMATSALQAQSADTTRILRATYYDDNHLMIQVSLADGDSISQASLFTDNQEIELTTGAESAQVEQWFLLDASMTMRDAIPLVKDELQTFVASNPDMILNAGIILPDDTRLEPVGDTDTFSDWLDSYTLSPDTAGCTLDALSDLPDVSDDPTLVRRIVVITAGSDSCSGDIPQVDTAIDIVVIGNMENTVYQRLIESGGVYYQSSILGLSESFSDLRQLWGGSVVLLSTSLDSDFDSAELVITLDNGETVSMMVEPDGEFRLPPTAVPTSTPTEIPTVMPTQTETPVPTSTVEASEEVTVETASTETPESTEILAVQNEATPEPETESEPPASTNSQVIIGGGIAAAIVVIFVTIYLLRGRGRGTQPETFEDDDSTGKFRTVLPDDDETPDHDRTVIVTEREMEADRRTRKVAELVNVETDTIYDILRPMTTLGRRAGSDILIEGDNQISREHIRFITRDDGTIQAARMTTNPIEVNGEAMDTSQQLSDGDVLALSPTLTLIFRQVRNEEQENT